MELLSDHLRRLCDQAIDNATSAGRKTVLERDYRTILDRDR
jgi:histone H3/H4